MEWREEPIGERYVGFPCWKRRMADGGPERNGAGLSPGPAFFRHRGRCIDVDKTRTAINHRVAREKKESFGPVYSSHAGSRQFAAVSLSPADNGSLSGWLCSPVERTRGRIRIRGRIHGLFKRRPSLRLSLSLSACSLPSRSGSVRAEAVLARPRSRQSVARALLLRILGRGILSQRWPDATWTKRADEPLIIGAGGFRKSIRPVSFSMTEPRRSFVPG